jgi:hypothetical protein
MGGSTDAHVGRTGAKRETDVFDFAGARVITRVQAGMRLVGAAAVLPCTRHFRDTRIGQGIEDEDLPNVVERAWYVSGTWLVTGEHKKDTITPTRPLPCTAGGRLTFFLLQISCGRPA